MDRFEKDLGLIKSENIILITISLTQTKVRIDPLQLWTKFTYGPFYLSSKFMITCQIEVLVQFQIDRICTFDPV